MSMSTSLLRVHSELSKVAREHAGLDEGIPTEINGSAIKAMPAFTHELPLETA